MNSVGKKGEDLSAKFFKKKKYRILERNIHLSHNEIDIIALSKKEKTIVFVEVKTRSVTNGEYADTVSPASAVTKKKQERTLEAAMAYLHANPKFSGFCPRLDVVEVFLEAKTLKPIKINHIENAFGI